MVADGARLLYSTAMLDLTKIYLFIFGILTIGGGIMGYVKAGSPASIIAGSISGVLLLVAGYLVGAGKVQAGLILGLVLSLALASQFLPISQHEQIHAGGIDGHSRGYRPRAHGCELDQKVAFLLR